MTYEEYCEQLTVIDKLEKQGAISKESAEEQRQQLRAAYLAPENDSVLPNFEDLLKSETINWQDITKYAVCPLLFFKQPDMYFSVQLNQPDPFTPPEDLSVNADEMETRMERVFFGRSLLPIRRVF